MTAYYVYPSSDHKQIDGNAITSTSTNVTGGTLFAAGTSVPASGLFTTIVQLGGRSEAYGSQIVKSKNLFGAFQSDATAITSVADSGGGFAKYTLAGHSLVVGDVINVSGSTSAGVDGVQKVTAKDTNTFTTDKAYTASASAGSYYTVAGTFATMTADSYVMLGYASSLAGGQKSLTGFGCDYGIRRSIHKLEAMRTVKVATALRAGYWVEYTASWSTNPSVANDISTFGTDHAATPTLAIPGELVYRQSGRQDATYGVIQNDYPAKG